MSDTNELKVGRIRFRVHRQQAERFGEVLRGSNPVARPLWRRALTACVALAGLAPIGCSTPSDQSAGAVSSNAAQNGDMPAAGPSSPPVANGSTSPGYSIVGTWTEPWGSHYTFKPDGSFNMSVDLHVAQLEEPGSYTLAGSKLTIRYAYIKVTTSNPSYQAELQSSEDSLLREKNYMDNCQIAWHSKDEFSMTIQRLPSARKDTTVTLTRLKT